MATLLSASPAGVPPRAGYKVDISRGQRIGRASSERFSRAAWAICAYVQYGVADRANGGIRREPELPTHVKVAPPKAPPQSEFDFVEDAAAEAAQTRAARLQEWMRTSARTARCRHAKQDVEETRNNNGWQIAGTRRLRSGAHNDG